MSEKTYETIDGSITYIVFNSDSFMVARVETKEGKLTITGPSFDFEMYQKYTFKGNYIVHPKYGYQFSYISVSKYMPTKKDEIIRFLSSSLFKGVGKKAAEKVYEKFGDDTFKVLKEDPSLLETLDITQKQLDGLRLGLQEFGNESNDLLFSLISAGFTNLEARRITYHYKDNTAFILEDNPYRIYLDVYGIPFNKVCEIAKKIDVENKEHKFKVAYLIYLFKETSFKTGDIYLYKEDFSNTYLKNYDDFDDVLDMCVDQNLLIKEEDRYYLTSDYEDERYIAKYLKAPKDSLTIDDDNLNTLIKDEEFVDSIKFDDKQIEAITKFFKEDLSLIVGGPGTGKTTIIKALVNIFKKHFPYNNIIVVAPTGRAAKRINEICNVESKTIHSLLKWNKDDNTFINNESNPITYDCLIIDEFSMVDNALFSSLLKASTYIRKICIIGDNNQLPSIRQGNLLEDLIDSNVFLLTYLETNHRQKEGNEIISLANDIVNNNVDLDKYHDDIKFYDINKLNYNDLTSLINKDIDEGINFDDIQVLAPMYKNEYGIDILNKTMQEAFNPHNLNKNEKKVGEHIFREDDKILELRNRPNDDVYNGDIGVLKEIDDEQKYFLVYYQKTAVFYEFNDLDDITLAYALSVHKSQGSEYKVVYFLFNKTQRHMLYKKLIYTAISRAKVKLVLIGEKDIFESSIKRELNRRKTTLIDRLK